MRLDNFKIGVWGAFRVQTGGLYSMGDPNSFSHGLTTNLALEFMG